MKIIWGFLKKTIKSILFLTETKIIKSYISLIRDFNAHIQIIKFTHHFGACKNRYKSVEITNIISRKPIKTNSNLVGINKIQLVTSMPSPKKINQPKTT